MSSTSPQKRGNPFARTKSQSPGPTSPPTSNGRPNSMIIPSQLSPSQSPQDRIQSYSSLAGLVSPNNAASRYRSNSKSAIPSSNTFAPSFIRTDEMRRGPEIVKGIEGENDFSGKRYVWLKDPQAAFVKGWVVEDLGSNQILVQCDDGSVYTHSLDSQDGIANFLHSNEKLTQKALIKSIRRSLTKRMIWQSLHTSTKPQLYTTSTRDTRPT